MSVFSHLHPPWPPTGLPPGCAEQVEVGQAVSIDLTLPPETQRARYRRNHKRDLKKLSSRGIRCVADPHLHSLDAFIELYHDTMRRLDAAAYYR